MQGATVTAAAQKAKRPALTAGAAAVGLASGLALGSRIDGGRGGLSRLVTPRRRVLGMPLGRKSGLRRTVETLGKAAHGLGSATRKCLVGQATTSVRCARSRAGGSPGAGPGAARLLQRQHPAGAPSAGALARGQAIARSPRRAPTRPARRCSPIGGPATQVSPPAVSITAGTPASFGSSWRSTRPSASHASQWGNRPRRNGRAARPRARPPRSMPRPVCGWTWLARAGSPSRRPGAQPVPARDGAGGLALEQHETLDGVLEVPVRRRGRCRPAACAAARSARGGCRGSRRRSRAGW